MPNDAITLKAIAKELNTILQNGRIEKIYQPEVDEIAIKIKAKGTAQNLIISANPSRPRIHLSTQKKENSLNAPAFCMLLRKYLIGSSINSIDLFNNDRIIKFSIDARNELSDKVQYFMMVELMGRYSNIILMNTDNVIIDAIRRIHFDQSTTRYILPGITYSLQPQPKITLNERERLKEFFDNTPQCDASTILSNISGISKDLAMEVAGSDYQFDFITSLWDINTNDIYSPCLIIKNEKISDYSVIPLSKKGLTYESVTTINDACDRYYSIIDTEERKKVNTKTIVTLQKRLASKVDRRIDDYTKKLKEKDKIDYLRQYGDLILSNIYLLNPKAKELVCQNYYDNTDVKIPLDDTLTAVQNANAYFKKYAKTKKAIEISEQQLVILYQQKEYLKTILASIGNCTLKQEYDQILTELNTLGGLKKSPKEIKKSKKTSNKPLYYKLDDCDIYIGKNNIQNAEVTFNIATGKDVWLHTKDYHGAHAIIKGECTEELLYKVACMVAFLSDGRTSDKINVDYTLKKYVKKHPSGLLGMVTYTNYKTIFVPPKSL